MIVTIPLKPIPAQRFTCPLAGQSYTFWLRQLQSGLYLDLAMQTRPLILGALCLHGTDIIRNPASPLQGTLTFTDTQGSQDPDYTGLGSRFVLQFEDTAS